MKPPKAEQGKKVKTPSAVQGPKKEHLTVSLRYLRKSHCLSNCDQEEKAAFADQIRQLTQLSWMEIGQKPRHGLGYEKIARTSLSVQLPDHLTPDVNIIAFRFSGLKPMVGYKDGETFHVLWFDRAFDVYPH